MTLDLIPPTKRKKHRKQYTNRYKRVLLSILRAIVHYTSRHLNHLFISLQLVPNPFRLWLFFSCSLHRTPAGTYTCTHPTQSSPCSALCLQRVNFPRIHLSCLTSGFDARRMAWERGWGSCFPATPCCVPLTTAIAELSSKPSAACLIRERCILWIQPCPTKIPMLKF